MASSRAKPGTSSRIRKSHAKASHLDVDTPAAHSAEPPPKPKRQPPIEWARNLLWTDILVTYLSEHTDFRIKLFSDSTAAAKKAGRSKLTAKDGRPQQWAVLASAIFAADEEHSLAFKSDPKRFANSVDTCMRRLKSDYQGYLKRIGATGAGLDPEMITGGSSLANLIDTIRQEWPWWDDLHAFWRELPNYNPIGVVSSEPGANHAAAAASLFAPRSDSQDPEFDEEEQDELDLDPDADNPGPNAGAGADADADAFREDDESGARDREPTSTPSAFRSPSITPPPPAVQPVKLVSKAVGGRDRGLAKIAATSKGKAAPIKTAAKKTVLDKFNDNREQETGRLIDKRKMQHTEEMARIQNKRLKLQVKMLQLQNEAVALARANSPLVSSATPSTSSPHPSPTTTYQLYPSQQNEAGPSRLVSHVQESQLDFSPIPGFNGDYALEDSSDPLFLTNLPEYNPSHFTS